MSMAVSSCGSCVAVISGGSCVLYKWRPEGELSAEMCRFEIGVGPDGDACLSFSPHNRFLAIGDAGTSGIVSLWDLLPGKTRLPGEAPPALLWQGEAFPGEPITAIEVGESCAIVAAASVSGGIRVFELRSVAAAAESKTTTTTTTTTTTNTPSFSSIRTHLIPLSGPTALGDKGAPAPRRGGRPGAGKWTPKALALAPFDGPDSDTLFVLESSERGGAVIAKWHLNSETKPQQPQTQTKSSLITTGPDDGVTTSWSLALVRAVARVPLTCMNAYFPASRQRSLSLENPHGSSPSLQHRTSSSPPHLHPSALSAGTLALGGSDGSILVIDTGTLVSISARRLVFNDRPISAIAMLPESGVVIASSPFVNALDRSSPNFGCVALSSVNDSRAPRARLSRRVRGCALFALAAFFISAWIGIARWAKVRKEFLAATIGEQQRPGGVGVNLDSGRVVDDGGGGGEEGSVPSSSLLEGGGGGVEGEGSHHGLEPIVGDEQHVGVGVGVEGMSSTTTMTEDVETLATTGRDSALSADAENLVLARAAAEAAEAAEAEKTVAILLAAEQAEAQFLKNNNDESEVLKDEAAWRADEMNRMEAAGIAVPFSSSPPLEVVEGGGEVEGNGVEMMMTAPIIDAEEVLSVPLATHASGEEVFDAASSSSSSSSDNNDGGEIMMVQEEERIGNDDSINTAAAATAAGGDNTVVIDMSPFAAGDNTVVVDMSPFAAGDNTVVADMSSSTPLAPDEEVTTGHPLFAGNFPVDSLPIPIPVDTVFDTTDISSPSMSENNNNENHQQNDQGESATEVTPTTSIDENIIPVISSDDNGITHDYAAAEIEEEVQAIMPEP